MKPKKTKRPRCPYAEHVVDNQGLCHGCGKLLTLDYWEAYAGNGARVPS